MAKKLTSISAGLAVREVLLEALGDRVSGVFPVTIEQDAAMPYIVYYRMGVNDTPTKEVNAFDICDIQIDVWTKSYAEGVAIAEDVRSAIAGQELSYVDDNDSTRRLKVGCSNLIDCDESARPGAFRQGLTIRCKIL